APAKGAARSQPAAPERGRPTPRPPHLLVVSSMRSATPSAKKVGAHSPMKIPHRSARGVSSALIDVIQEIRVRPMEAKPAMNMWSEVIPQLRMVGSTPNSLVMSAPRVERSVQSGQQASTHRYRRAHFAIAGSSDSSPGSGERTASFIYLGHLLASGRSGLPGRPRPHTSPAPELPRRTGVRGRALDLRTNENSRAHLLRRPRDLTSVERPRTAPRSAHRGNEPFATARAPRQQIDVTHISHPPARRAPRDRAVRDRAGATTADRCDARLAPPRSNRLARRRVALELHRALLNHSSREQPRIRALPAVLFLRGLRSPVLAAHER